MRGKRPLRLEEISFITSLILERVSSIPRQPISNLYVRSEEVVYVNSDDTVSEAARKMMKGDFTQLPVFDKESKTWLGFVTDYNYYARKWYLKFYFGWVGTDFPRNSRFHKQLKIGLWMNNIEPYSSTLSRYFENFVRAPQGFK